LASGSLKLLVVANATDAPDVLAALSKAGLPEPALGSGGDETLDLFEESEPDVVLLAAGLQEGDLPSLAGAMRSGSHGRPAPIVLIGSQDELRTAADVKMIAHDHFIARPIDFKALADAVMESSRAATGARLEAAMAMAIEDFVADAMGSLSVSITAAEVAAAPSRTPPPEVPAEAESSAPTGNWREPTQVLSAAGPGDSRPGLDEESEELLDEMLPGETIDPIDDFDSYEDYSGGASGEGSAEDEESEDEPSGGDFARQLREKMSAMAERLFPGQSSDDNTVNISPPSAAHTEIDLGSIVDDSHDEDSDFGVSTQAMVSESEITMARGSESGVTTGQLDASGQSFVGEIDAHENDMAAVLAHFWSSDFTGCLVLRREEEEKRVQFDKGSVVFTSSGTSDDRMSDLLVREGKINQEQLDECRAQVASSGRRMGEVLVDKGYLKPRELLPAVRQHLEDIFYSLFAWTSGSYDALPAQALDERIRLSRHPAALIVEGVRRKYDQERIEACLGNMDTLVEVDKSARLTSIVSATELSAGELQAQRLFDGSHSLEEIAAECDVKALRVAQLAHALVCLGVAEVVDSGTDESAERKAPATHLVGETDLEIDRQRVLAKYKLVQSADYFQLLGVRLDASAFEIRRAYEAAQRHFAMESFPAPLQEELNDMICQIGELIEEAFLVLSNDSFRSSYRANLQ
jgi:hypothetical protein